MHLRLNQRNIHTAEQLCQASVEELRAVWGSVTGEWIWHWLRGHDLVTAATHRKTVGHSYVLPPAERTDARSHAVFTRLISKVASRLRYIQYWAGAMVVGISYEDHSHWHADAPLGCCQDTLTMIEAFEELWQRRPQRQPKKLSVTLIHLTSHAYATQPLFDSERHRVRLAAAMDRVNSKFGQHRIYFGGMHGAQESAPPRIAFTRIPDESDFGEKIGP
jgi:DNA polymerase-4